MEQQDTRHDISPQALLQASIDSIEAVVIFAVDTEYRYLYFNTAHATMLANSYGTTAARGKIVFECILNEKDREKLHANIDHALAGQSRAIVQEYGDSGRRMFEGRYSPIVEGVHGIVGVIISSVDISGRLLAGKALYESQERFTMFMESSPALAWVKDTDGRFLYVNKAWERTYGMVLDDVMGRTAFDIFPFEVADLMRQSDLEVLITDSPAERKEETFEIGGRRFCWNTNKFQFRTSSGQRLLGGIAIDMTESKRRDAEQKNLERQLIGAQRMESIGTLASGIAHDFNNILSVILGNAEILTNTPGGSEMLQRRMHAIVKASERGASIVNQLLAVAGQTEIQPQAVDVNGLILDLIELLEATFPKTIVLVHALSPSLPEIVGDMSQLHQVLLNLCLNARDALPAGGTIRIGTSVIAGASLRARFPRADAERYIVVSVKDDGVGMDDAVQKRIFDPFFTTKGKGRGVGLGLAVTNGIVESHSGFVDVTSVPDTGSVFDIYLPISDHVPGRRERPDTAAVVRGGSETILFIEDEDAIREIAGAVFSNNGYTVIFAASGSEGVEQFRLHHAEIALVISDYGLPVFDGEEVYAQIRQLNAAVPFALASGCIAPEKRSRLAGLGIGAIVSKPYAPKELLAVARRLIDGAAV